jgi:diguanylate cyclase (GGDEF)-like protein
MNEMLISRLKNCSTLPSLPAVALQIIKASNEPDVSISDVANLVKMDPAIASKILMVTNSPLYGLRRRVDNLRQAMALLGLNACLTLALNFSLISSLRKKRKDGMDYDLYWRRSLISAVACQVLGAEKGLTSLEQLFLSGLLQDIGILVLDKLVPGEYADIYARADNHRELYEIEKQTLGGSHDEVGAWLLGHWHFPDIILSAVSGSHSSQPGPIAGDEDCFHRCVSLSGWLADIWLTDDREGALITAAKNAKDLLGMDKTVLTGVIERISDALPEISNMFGVEFSSPDQAEVILEQAREAMMRQNLKMLQQLEEQKHAMAVHVRELEEKTLRDGMTGLYNREYLDKALTREYASASEQGWPLSIVFIDLDRFKDINDTYGHQFGDKVLISTARFLMQEIRQCDIAARYGGEEFVLVLPGLETAKARNMLDRLRSKFSKKVYITNAGEKIQLTFSAGLATHMEKQCFDSVQDLIREADCCMYTAKQAGRNRVEVCGA